MGFCIGGKWCRTQKCNERCKAMFPLAPELERGCKNLCKSGRYTFTKEEYLCSGMYVPDADVIRRYGFDPCPTTGITIPEFVDPLNDRAADQERKVYERELLQQVLIIGAGLLVLVLIIFAVIRIK